MVGRVESVKGNYALVIDVDGRIGSCATYLGVMVLEDRDSGYFIPNICWLDSCF